jgi:sn-glycerol 3-phosphate transport system substrate-binding protein
MNKHLLGACLAATTALAPVGARAEITIDWWHAMGGELGEILEGIAAGFNETQSEYRVVP